MPYASYTYNSYNGKLKSETYADGTVLTYTYDNLDRVKSVNRGNDLLYSVTYDGNGNLSSYTEGGMDGKKYEYEYDSIGRLIRSNVSKADGSTLDLRDENVYDAVGRLSRYTYKVKGFGTRYTQYNYDANGRLSKNRIANGDETSYSYDSLDRVSSKSTRTA